MKRSDMSLMNKTVFENLIKAGAFDELHRNRAMLLNALPKYLEAVQTVNNMRNSSQLGLFGDDTPSDTAITAEPEMPTVPDFDPHTRLDYEKQVTGLYISGHPWDQYQHDLSPYTNCTVSGVASWTNEAVKPCVAGIVSSLKEKSTKKGAVMCTLQLEDTESAADAVIFPKTWETLKGTISPGEPILIEGRLDDRHQLITDRILTPDDLPSSQKYITLSISASALRGVNMKVFAGAVMAGGAKGSSRVILEIAGEGEIARVMLSVFADGGKLTERLSRIFPPESFSLRMGA